MTLRPRPPLDTDEQLLEASAAGDQAAFARLFRRHASHILGFLINMLKDRELAEEVAQEVFLQAWRRAEAFDPARASARSWLFLIARSRAKDAQRSNSARQRREQERASEDIRMSGRNPAREFEARASVRSALGVLSSEQRECVTLAFFEGLSIAQIARRLSIPLGTAKSRYRYGLNKLREAFAGGQCADV